MMAILLSIGLAACGSDKDEEPSMSFTQEIIVGKWKIASISGESGHVDLKVGVEMVFKADGTCNGWFSMEDAYKIENGRVCTYYAKSGEPMFVYTLLSQNGTMLSVRMNGTLDDKTSCTLMLQKIE